MKKFDSREKKEFCFFKNDTKEVCQLLFELSSLMKISKDFGSFYEFGFLNNEQGKLIKNEIKENLKKLKRFTVSLTDSMLPIDQLFDSMLAPSDGELYKSITNKIYSAP